MQYLIKELKRYAVGLSCLYVEDNDAVREEVFHILSKFFDSVDTAANGKEGIDKYADHMHDLVITDIRMPVMDGVSLSKQMRQLNRDSAILIMSAHDDSRYLSELINTGIDKFIMKPLDNVRFLQTLLTICKTIANEKQIERYKANTDAIFRSVSEAIVTVNNEMIIIEANDAALRFCGLADDNIIGRDFTQAFGSCTERLSMMLADTIKTGVPAKADRVECKKDSKGITIAAITACPLLDSEAKQYGAVMVIRDDTYVSQIETELGQRRQYDKLIGKSGAMQRVYSVIENIADIKTTVLITGETGTGKELAAEAVHYGGGSDVGPLVKVNCGALAEGLLESELFGHVKGAFTGAITDKDGRFQKADGGTIFLDEIGDISLSAQIRLLRVLQEFQFERVGSSMSIKVNVRVIAATNRNLKELVHSGTFREDLYYRLNVVQLNLPPLRDRREDIPHLVRHFIDIFNLRHKRNVGDISSDCMKIFMTYPWPGNVRELEHALEHAYVMCNGQIITLNDLPEDITIETAMPVDIPDERDRIVRALEQCQWRKNKAAALLGISRVTLYDKMRKYNIKI
ncbi:MAG: sigma-54-dependent Fis family transcriptional regulator [Candidatus Magnetominusculus sp. LBB02]|nr:sigma-54-dependent Fis family transcriptional regulator [Candidatus Magnetominusculus sp. LBB02]